MKESFKERALKAVVLAIENYVIHNVTHEYSGTELYLMAQAYETIAKAAEEKEDDEE